MSKKTETFGEFPPEKGSKDEETKKIENLEAWQKLCEELSDARGELTEADWNEMVQDQMESEAREVSAYIKRARIAGDKRPDREIIWEMDDLETAQNEYVEQRKKDGTYTNPWDMCVDYMKTNVPSYASYLAKRQAEDSEANPWNVYLEWKLGKDLEE